MGLLDNGMHTPIRAPGVINPKQVAFRGTTAANGDITLAAGSDYEASFAAPTRNTNTYTVSIGSFKTLYSFQFLHSAIATINIALGTIDANAGTIQFTASATLNAVDFSCVINVDRGSE